MKSSWLFTVIKCLKELIRTFIPPTPLLAKRVVDSAASYTHRIISRGDLKFKIFSEQSITK
jgi:hypothetical protein